MNDLMRTRQFIVASSVLLGVALLTGCSGAGGGTVSPPANTPTPAPTSSPASTPTPAASPTPAPTGSSNAGGMVGIGVPTAAPVVCSPSPITVAVGQISVVECAAQGYSGPLGWSIADATIASVSRASGTYTFFYIFGLKGGTTSLSLAYPPSGTGSVLVVVKP